MCITAFNLLKGHGCIAGFRLVFNRPSEIDLSSVAIMQRSTVSHMAVYQASLSKTSQRYKVSSRYDTTSFYSPSSRPSGSDPGDPVQDAFVEMG